MKKFISLFLACGLLIGGQLGVFAGLGDEYPDPLSVSNTSVAFTTNVQSNLNL